MIGRLDSVDCEIHVRSGEVERSVCFIYKAEYLYHGSPYLFDTIEPQQASGSNKECSQNAIYASDMFD